MYSIAALVIIGLGGFFIQAAMKAAKQSGYHECKAAQMLDNTIANEAAKKEVQNVAKKERAIKDDGLDDALRGLGIMRDDKDY